MRRELSVILERSTSELSERWRGKTLADYVPCLLDRIIRRLRGRADARTASIIVAEGTTLAEALSELGTFRQAVIDCWEGAQVEAAEVRLVHATIDRAMVEIADFMQRDLSSTVERYRQLTARIHSEALLRESEERYQLALSAADVGTWDYDPRTGEITWDSRLRAMSGFDADEPVNYDIFLSLLHPDDRGRVDELVQRSSDPASGGGYSTEYRLIRKSDGVERWQAARGKVFFDPQGKPVRFIGTGVDITDRHLEADFRERFVGILGHDLRQPLSVVNFGAALLAKQPNMTERDVAMLQRIARAGERMTRMIGDLLDFARGRQTGGIPVTRAPADLFAVVRQLLTELEAVHADRIFLLTADGDGEGEWDRDRMAQVFGNLLSNAVAYGTPEHPIDVRMAGAGPRLEVAVTNRGPTIAAQDLRSLFDPYRRGHKTRGSTPSGGLGLGLYIASEIVRAHGGTLVAESAPATGTTFRVLLPRQRSL